MGCGTLRCHIVLSQELLQSLQCQRLELECIASLGDEILGTCHPDSVITIKSWVTVAKSRFQEVSWAPFPTPPGVGSRSALGASTAPCLSHRQCSPDRPSLMVLIVPVTLLRFLCTSCSHPPAPSPNPHLGTTPGPLWWLGSVWWQMQHSMGRGPWRAAFWRSPSQTPLLQQLRGVPATVGLQMRPLLALPERV